MEPEPDPLASAPRRVEAYLDQILAPLARKLSPFHREELRRELREHLWARADAYRELGQSADEAVTEALRQFGGAEDFLRQWRREWTKTPQRLTLREAWDAGRAAFKPSLAGISGGILPFAVLLEYPYSRHDIITRTLMGHQGTMMLWTVATFAFLLLPALVGAKQGHRTPERAGVGMLVALTALGLAAGLLYEIGDWAAPDNPQVEGLFTILLALTAAWLPVAGGAAAISSRWTRRSQVRRLASTLK